MTDDLTRRDFLKGAGFAIAGVIGIIGVSKLTRAQEPKQEDPKDKTDREQEPEEPNEDDLFEDDDSSEEETRACPQCGALMYKQGDTWTCETCGFSYVE